MWNLVKSDLGRPYVLETVLSTCPLTLGKLLNLSVSQFPLIAQMGVLFILLYFTKCWKDYKQCCNKYFYAHLFI